MCRRNCEKLELRNLLTFAFNYRLVDLPIDESHSAVQVQAADLNGDAHLDLIVATVSSSHYSRYQQLRNLADGPVAWTDFEGSHIDFLFGTEAGYEFVGREHIPSLVLGLNHADLDGDDRQDLVIHTDQGVLAYLDRGLGEHNWRGLEQTDTIQLTNVWKVDTGDFNGDRFADLVVGVGDEVQVLHGNGNGTFEQTFRISFSEYRDVIDYRSFDVGDTNSDSLDDMVVLLTTLVDYPYRSTTTVSLVNDTMGSFLSTEIHPGEEFTFGTGSVFLFDINSDGNLDVLLSEDQIDFLGLRRMLGDGRGSFALDDSVCCVPGGRRIEAEDGTRAHTLVPTAAGGSSMLFFEDENVGVELAPWTGRWWENATASFVDLNSDGSDELIDLDERNLVVISKSPPSSLIAPAPIKIHVGEQLGKFIDDFDQDGFADILAIDTVRFGVNEFSVRTYWGTPSGISETHDAFTLDLGETNPYFDFDLVLGRVIDIDDDGFPDIRLRVDGGTISILNAKGRAFEVGSFDEDVNEIPIRSPGLPSRPPAVAMGDINDDGYADRVTVHDTWYNGLMTIQQGLSEHEVDDVGITQTFEKPFDPGLKQFQKAVRLQDLTGDGVLDVVYSDWATADILVFAGVLDPSGSNVNEDPEVIVGDANLDRRVDFSDFLVLTENYGTSDARWNDGDFDGDSQVGFSDFLLLSSNFGVDGV